MRGSKWVKRKGWKVAKWWRKRSKQQGVYVRMPSGSKGSPPVFYISCQPVYLYHSTSPHHRSSVEFIINVSPFIIPLTRYKLCIYLRRKVISTFYTKPRWERICWTKIVKYCSYLYVFTISHLKDVREIAIEKR